MRYDAYVMLIMLMIRQISKWNGNENKFKHPDGCNLNCTKCNLHKSLTKADFTDDAGAIELICEDV